MKPQYFYIDAHAQIISKHWRLVQGIGEAKYQAWKKVDFMMLVCDPHTMIDFFIHAWVRGAVYKHYSMFRQLKKDYQVTDEIIENTYMKNRGLELNTFQGMYVASMEGEFDPHDLKFYSNGFGQGPLEAVADLHRQLILDNRISFIRTLNSYYL